MMVKLSIRGELFFYSGRNPSRLQWYIYYAKCKVSAIISVSDTSFFAVLHSMGTIVQTF